MAICEICGKTFDKTKRRFQSKHNLCSNKCKYTFLGNINKKHGMANKKKLYGVWKSLRQRCTNKNDPRYKDYGERGIQFCKEWENFESFYNWAMTNGYKYEPLKSGRNKLTLDRINNNGNYCPENCRWVDDYVQANNKRNSIPKEIKYTNCIICGKPFKRTISRRITCSIQCGFKHRTLLHKEKTKDMFKKECPICHKIFEDRSGHFKERIYCSPKCNNASKSPIWEFNGESRRVIEWAEITGVNAHCLLHRKELGWSIDKILSTPKRGESKRYD